MFTLQSNRLCKMLLYQQLCLLLHSRGQYILVVRIAIYLLLYKKKYPVDFDDELKIGDVRYDNMTKITIKVQLFSRLPYEM